LKYGAILRFLSVITAIITGCMMIPLAISVFEGSGDVPAFVVSIIIGFAVAAAFFFFSREADLSRMGTADAYASVSLSWITASAISALPYFFYGAAPTYTDAFFESISGYTTTGGTVFPNFEILPRSIIMWRAITHWLGGMGIIGFTLALMPLLGAGRFRIFSAESTGMIHEKMTPRIRQTAIYLWLIYAGLTLALTVLLMGGGMSFFDAVSHGMGTISTGGFSTHTANIAYYNSPYFEWVIIIFMFLSGTNFMLHFYALKGRSVRHYFKDPEFRFYAISVSVLSLFVSADLFAGGFGSLLTSLRAGVFHVASFVTTTGFVAGNYELWPGFSKSVLFICLFLGGCACSTAGGIKQVRLLVMLNSVRQRFRQMLNPKTVVILPVASHTLDPEVLSSCMAFFGLYAMVFIAGSFALSLFEPNLITALSGAATALGNVGLAFGGLGAADNFSAQAPEAKWILSFLMLCGRLELYTLLSLYKIKHSE